MDENQASALQYGHLGKAVYLPDIRSWSFSRTFEPPSVISSLGISKTTVPSHLSASRLPSSESNVLIPNLHPDLAACWSSVTDEKISHAITTISELCDPRVSSLFDLGHAVDIEKDAYSSGVVPIAVAATGDCRNRISFLKVEEDTVELTESKHQISAQLRVPCVGDAESAEWSAGTASVRQICFARTIEEPATWVAARFPQSTAIFRPLYSQIRIPMHADREYGYATRPNFHNSHLDANPLIEISSSRTGGFAHADVTFNPWYPKQIGIVDEGGNWSIWGFTGRHRRNKGDWSSASISSGSLPWLDLGRSRGLDSRIRHDGWAAIEWAGDVNSFVVADRRCLTLYRMEGNLIKPHSVELGLERKSEWILDIKRSQADVSHVFILTTARILWLDVSPVILAPNEREASVPLSPRLSWNHYRDTEDTSLRLSSLLFNEDLYLLLYSRLNRFVLAFQCRMPSGGQTGMIHAPDPFILDVPSADDPGAPGPDAHFSTLILREITSHPIRARRHEPNARLLKLFVLDSNLAICESVYLGPDRESSMDEQLSGHEVVWSKRHRPAGQIARFANDFVVDDWDESVLGLSAPKVPHSSVSPAAPLVLSSWVIDFTPVYAVAMGKLAVASSAASTEQAPERGFRESIEQLDVMISSAELSAQSTSSTVLELFGKGPPLDDIDQNAQDLQQLSPISAPRNGHSFVFLPHSLSSFLSAHSVRLAESSPKLDLVGTYDSLVNDWLSCLSRHIPLRTRIMKEKVLRGVAVDLVLARINVSKEPHPEDQTKGRGTSEPSGVAYDTVPSKTAASERPRVGGKWRETPDISRSPNNSAGMSDSQGPNYSSLASLTTFNSQTPSRKATSIISHWQPGTSPVTYDWQATVQELESGNETSRPASRAGSRKRSSRTRSFASQTPPATPAVLPAARIWGSQPDGAGAPVKVESSQLVEEDLPMTQVERGVFGGREASRKSVMKGRKRRAAGF